MNVLEVEGKTADDATKKALKKLGISDASSVKIEVIDEGKSGIFGFGVSRPAKIRLYYSEENKDIGEPPFNSIKTAMHHRFDIVYFLVFGQDRGGVYPEIHPIPAGFRFARLTSSVV